MSANRPLANNAAANTSATASTKEASPSKPERLQFSGGESDGSWTREIPANGSIDFVANAKKDQTFGFQVGYEGKASDVAIFLTEPELQDVSMKAAPEERKEFRVKKGGDHRLTVNNMTGKAVTMTLYVDIS